MWYPLEDMLPAVVGPQASPLLGEKEDPARSERGRESARLPFPEAPSLQASGELLSQQRVHGVRSRRPPTTPPYRHTTAPSRAVALLALIVLIDVIACSGPYLVENEKWYANTPYLVKGGIDCALLLMRNHDQEEGDEHAKKTSAGLGPREGAERPHERERNSNCMASFVAAAAVLGSPKLEWHCLNAAHQESRLLRRILDLLLKCEHMQARDLCAAACGSDFMPEANAHFVRRQQLYSGNALLLQSLLALNNKVMIRWMQHAEVCLGWAVRSYL